MTIPFWRRLAVALVLACAARPAAAQFTLLGPDSARVTLNGRVHAQFATTTADDVPSADVFLRRVRLEAAVVLNDVVSGKIQPEFAGSRVSLRDAYVRFTLHPALQLLAGQAHRPFSRIEMTSSNRIVPIERGVRIDGVDDAFDQYALVEEAGYAGRDVGLQLGGRIPGAPLGLGYAVGWFRGPAREDAPEEDTDQWVARLTAAPAPWMEVGASVSSRDFTRDLADDILIPGERGTAWEVDAALGSARRGPHLLAEVAWGDSDPRYGRRFFGAQGWLSYRTGPVSGDISGIEPLLRVSYGDPETDDEGIFRGITGGVLVTPGVNVWLGGQNRLMVNYDIWNPEYGEGDQSAKVQFQLAF